MGRTRSAWKASNLFTLIFCAAYLCLPSSVCADDDAQEANAVCVHKSQTYASLGNLSNCVNKQLESKRFLATLYFPYGSEDLRILDGCVSVGALSMPEGKTIYDNLLIAECFRVEVCSCSSNCLSSKQFSDSCESEYYNSPLGGQLIDAVIAGDTSRVVTLLHSGADANYNEVSFKNVGGATPLHFAASRNNTSIAAILLKNKADIDAADNDGQTPLDWALHEDAEDAVEVIDLLIQAGAHLSLHRAAQLGRLSDVQAFARNIQDVNAVDGRGITALYYAAEKCRPEVAAFLINKGAMIDAADKSQFTPLHEAAANGCPSVASLLLEHNANANVITENLSPFHSILSPLHLAAAHCEASHLRVAELLIQAKADPNLKDSAGETALHAAARKNCVAMARILLLGGAEANTRDKLGETPLDEVNSAPQMEELLQQYGGKHGHN